MYKRFQFEGDIHHTLDCVPLAVRRKLDLAALKISLEGWQMLRRTERVALCHLPVETEEAIAVYREYMLAVCDDAGVALKPLVDANAFARTWNALEVPRALALRAEELHAALTNATWCRLDEESRYALLKLSDPKRNPLKLHALLVELGLLEGPAPVVEAAVIVCEPAARDGSH